MSFLTTLNQNHIGGKTINLLEENTGEKFHNIGFGNDLLEMTPKAQATKEKNR